MVLIAHTYFLSIFDIQKQEYIKHIQYQSDIKETFKSYHKDDCLCGILLNNGKLYLYKDINDDTESDSVTKLQVEGEIMKIYRDADAFKAFFIMHKVDGNLQISCIRDMKVEKCDYFKDVDEDTNIIIAQQESDDIYVL